MVKVYVADISELPDPKDYPGLLDRVTKQRREKISHYRQKKDRKQCLGAGLLLKQCFEEYGISVEDISYGENGKPEVKGIHFNLSHSHDMVVCAISGQPVGCDIEKTDKVREGIAERFFTDSEIKYLNKFDEDLRKEEFYRLWTMKESYIKMTGEGMTLSLKKIEFDITDKVNVFRDSELCKCYIKEYEIPGYKLTVCAVEEEFADSIDNRKGILL